jgi:hypothetical protein
VSALSEEEMRILQQQQQQQWWWPWQRQQPLFAHNNNNSSRSSSSRYVPRRVREVGVVIGNDNDNGNGNDDNDGNNNDGKFEAIPSKAIMVGDIVKVKKNQPIPCDMILLSTSDTDTGMCV